MKRIHFSLFLFIFAFTSANAQTVPKTPIKQCSGMLARQLIEQQADDNKSVAETDRRVNILLRVADYLWLANEPTARKYFTEAFQIARDRFRENSVEKTKGKEGLTIYQPDYRFDVISAVAKRDAGWAQKLSEIVLKEYDEDKEKDRREE